MTDTLDDLLSTTEVTPRAPTPPSTAESIVKACPECGATKTKLGVPFLTNGQIGTHRASVHGYRVPPGEKKSHHGATPAKKAAPTATAAKRPAAPTRARKPLGESLAKIALQLGRIVNTVEPPTGAAIMFEAGALGEALDRAIAGTIVDKPLQKAAGVSDRFQDLVPLVTMPAMIFLLSRNPEIEKHIEGELREALEDVLVQSLPLLRKRAARTKATVDALAELRALDPDLVAGNDPIGDLLRSFFTPVVVEESEDGTDSPS
jgi:hypothetical protein